MIPRCWQMSLRDLSFALYSIHTHSPIYLFFLVQLWGSVPHCPAPERGHEDALNPTCPTQAPTLNTNLAYNIL